MNKINPLRVCYLSGQLGQGGAERQLYYYVKSLKKSGDDPYVLCLRKGDFWEKPIRDLGVPVIWVGNSTNRLIRLFTIVFQIFKHPTDIIHSQNFFTNFYAFFAGKLSGKPTLGSLRSDVYYDLEGMGKIGKLNLLFPNTIAANSRSAIENAVKLGKSRSQLFFLPNMVDETLFKPDVERTKDGTFQVIFIGTLWPPKRVDRIIHIAKICLDQNSSIDFKLFGDGIQRDELWDLAARLGVLNVNLHFLGKISDPQFYYKSANALLLMSDNEGTPNVILEAMASGLAVVATNVGGNNELVKDSISGFILDKELSEEAFAAKLIFLENNQDICLKMGEEGRKIIVENYSLDKCYKSLIEIYSVIS